MSGCQGNRRYDSKFRGKASVREASNDLAESLKSPDTISHSELISAVSGDLWGRKCHLLLLPKAKNMWLPVKIKMI